MMQLFKVFFQNTFQCGFNLFNYFSMHLHCYLLLNLALALSYLISRSILNSSLLQRKITQAQRLRFARYSVTISLLTFFIVPYLTVFNSLSSDSNFRFEPIIKNRSIGFLQEYETLRIPLTDHASAPLLPPTNSILLTILLIGCAIFIAQYIRNLSLLKKLQCNSLGQRRFNKVTLLFNTTIEIPCCWSFFHHHFVLIPLSFIFFREKKRSSFSHSPRITALTTRRYLLATPSNYDQNILLLESICAVVDQMVR